MKNLKFSKMIAIKIVLWIILLFTGLSIIEYIRWYYKYTIDPISYKPLDIGVLMPNIWFPIQIISCVVFFIVGILLLRLLKKYETTRFIGIENIKIFNFLIFACIFLASLGACKLAIDNYNQLLIPLFKNNPHFIPTLRIFLIVFMRFMFKLFISDMYLLLAMVLWVVKQFVAKAFEIKSENEAFI